MGALLAFLGAVVLFYVANVVLSCAIVGMLQLWHRIKGG